MRKLDAAIAEALGRKVKVITVPVYPQGMVDGYFYADGREQEIPHYSTDGNAMLTLIEEMRGLGWHVEDLWYQHIEKAPDYGWYVCFINHEGMSECSVVDGKTTLPEAVALAAHKARTGREWEAAKCEE